MIQKVLIFGIGGMLGHKLFEVLSNDERYITFGTLRDYSQQGEYLINDIDVFDMKKIEYIMSEIQPAVVINCIGILKQSILAANPKISIYTNALFPHLLQEQSEKYGSRFIHISTDCVFNGKKGNYTEKDTMTPEDLYGRSKMLGEVEMSNALTIRTSLIGHELTKKNGLLEWFLSQKGEIFGYDRAVFSGFTTLELAYIIRNVVIPNNTLEGLYNVSAKSISKFDLLCLIKDIYKKDIIIMPDSILDCNRSLNGSRFDKATGYSAPKWEILIKNMYKDYKHNESI